MGAPAVTAAQRTNLHRPRGAVTKMKQTVGPPPRSPSARVRKRTWSQDLEAPRGKSAAPKVLEGLPALLVWETDGRAALPRDAEGGVETSWLGGCEDCGLEAASRWPCPAWKKRRRTGVDGRGRGGRGPRAETPGECARTGVAARRAACRGRWVQTSLCRNPRQRRGPRPADGLWLSPCLIPDVLQRPFVGDRRSAPRRVPFVRERTRRLRVFTVETHKGITKAWGSCGGKGNALRPVAQRLTKKSQKQRGSVTLPLCGEARGDLPWGPRRPGLGGNPVCPWEAAGGSQSGNASMDFIGCPLLRVT